LHEVFEELSDVTSITLNLTLEEITFFVPWAHWPMDWPFAGFE